MTTVKTGTIAIEHWRGCILEESIFSMDLCTRFWIISGR